MHTLVISNHNLLLENPRYFLIWDKEMSEYVHIPEKQNVFVYFDGGYLKKGFINELSGKISKGGATLFIW